MTESSLPFSTSTGRPRRVSTYRIVQWARLGLFGAGLGGMALVLLGYALARLPAEPTTLMVCFAGLLTALASALFVHDAMRPDYVRHRSSR